MAKQHKKVSILFSVLFSFCLVLPFRAEAAILYLEPSQVEYHQGDTFLVEMRLDTEGEEINAVEVNLKLPSGFLEFIDFSKGDSILTFWPKEPSISDDTLSFIGGVPGGFKGEGRIGRIALRAKHETDTKPEHETEAKIEFLNTSRVLLNDGLGTLAKLSTFGADFTILAEKLEIPKDRWQEELEKDKIPPEPFEIKISQSPTVFEGKYFLSFSTFDRQTGISHYEVKEGKREWKRGKSPYLLEDQSLKSKILVTAVDKAGNERIAEILPPKKPFPYWLAVILILLGIGVIWWILRRITTKRTRNYEH